MQCASFGLGLLGAVGGSVVSWILGLALVRVVLVCVVGLVVRSVLCGLL